MTSFKFHKRERLCNQKTISSLFHLGNTFLCYPLKAVWSKVDDLPSGETGQLPHKVQVAFSIPKKRIKKAVKRNLLKRRMRESYRIRKHKLYTCTDSTDKKIALMLIYVSKEALEFSVIEKAMGKVIDKLVAKLSHQDKEQP